MVNWNYLLFSFNTAIRQKVVSLYHKGYSLFSILKATSVPKRTCWDIVRKYHSRGHAKNRKSPGRPKNLDSKEEEQVINLSENDPKKIQLNFYGILTRKKLFHKFDTKNIILLSFACQNCYQKTYLTARNRLPRKVWAKEHALLPKIFWQNVLFPDGTTLELHPNKRVMVRRLPNTGMEKEFVGNQKIWRKKLMSWGFIAHDDRICLQKVCGTINLIKYLQIQQESLLPEMFLGEKLQQDNAPAHNSILSKT